MHQLRRGQKPGYSMSMIWHATAPIISFNHDGDYQRPFPQSYADACSGLCWSTPGALLSIAQMRRPFSLGFCAGQGDPGIGSFFANVTRTHFFLSMSESTTIQYYIPEDGDDLEHPNVIVMKKKASSIALKDIREVSCHLPPSQHRYSQSRVPTSSASRGPLRRHGAGIWCVHHT